MRRRLILGVLLALAALLGAGCHSGGARPAQTTMARVVVHWPAESRLIPRITRSVKVRVSVLTDWFNETQLLVRPAGGGVSEAVFAAVPVGDLTFRAGAHPGADGSGNEVASGGAGLSAVAGQVLNVNITMHSTIEHVSITPDYQPSVDLGGTLALTCTAYASHDVADLVLVDPAAWAWSSSDETIAKVDANGLVSGLKAGQATIGCRDTESGKEDQVVVTVRGGLPPGTTAGEERTNPKDGATVCWVPAGSFVSGVTEAQARALGGYTWWQTMLQTYGAQRTITLTKGFWMYKYEVTTAQFRAFCTATNRAMPTPPQWGFSDNAPIHNLSISDARAYAAWANAQLPTMYQWEKAARGVDGRLFSWGSDFDGDYFASWRNRMTWDGDIDGPFAPPPLLLNNGPAPVGSYNKDKSVFGVMDTVGNAMEWCEDRWPLTQGSSGYVDWTALGGTDPVGQGAHYAWSRGGDWLVFGGDRDPDADDVSDANGGGSTHYSGYYNFSSGSAFTQVGFRCLIEPRAPATVRARPR